jgi:hypothetical protein
MREPEAGCPRKSSKLMKGATAKISPAVGTLKHVTSKRRRTAPPASDHCVVYVRTLENPSENNQREFPVTAGKNCCFDWNK